MSSGKQNVQTMKLVLTCEHAFPDIPEKYRELFISDIRVLDTHEAYDPGAYDLFKELKILADFAHHQDIGRLLVESNRSLWHKNLFSRFSRELSKAEKQDILNTYYIPYRREVEENISQLIDSGNEVLHISVHSFTPVLYGQERNCDIGLLYDPQRNMEKIVTQAWKQLIKKHSSKTKVRFNYPYLGKADGFTTSLRIKFPQKYMGIELELNQKWVKDNKTDVAMKKTLFDSLQELKKRISKN